MSTPARFSDGQYKNWLKCSQSLIFMKEALHDYIDDEVYKLHDDITLKISIKYPCSSAIGNHCGSCLSENIELKRIKGVQHRTWYINCKKSICDKWLQQILAVHDEPHNPTINWKNADISKWPTDCYHVAKIFMPKGQDKTTKMPEDLDAPAILSLLKYCIWFRKDLPNTQMLSDLIDIRNKVLHSGDLRVADSDKDSWIDMMIQLLSDLNICGDVQSEIQMLKKEDIDINFRETEIRVLQKMMSGLAIDLTTVKADIASLQNSQSGLSEEMEKLRDNTTETTRKVDTAEADIEGTKKAMEELKSISDKMTSFFHKNPDITDTEITKTIRNIGTDVQELQQNLFRVETELKARVSSLEMQMEKHQEETKKHVEKNQEETKEQIEKLQEETKQQIDTYQEETKQQKDTYQEETKQQIDTYQDETKKQVEKTQEETKEQIEKLQEETKQQIDTYQDETKQQIDTYQEETKQQIDTYQEETKQQIDTYQEETKQQIDTYQEETKQQIDTYQDETKKQVEKTQEETKEQIEKLQEETKQQIDTYQEETKQQIDTYQEETKQQKDTYQEETKQQIDTYQEETKQQIDTYQEETKQQIEDIKKQAEGVERRMVTLEEQKKNDEQLSLQKDLKKTVEANLKETQETQKQVNELFKKQEDMKKDMKYLQERQLEKSRQWDSFSGKKQQVEMDEMRRQIDRSKVVLDEHGQHADEFFIENQRYTAGKKILDLHGKILITGKTGQGKTYLAYQLLLQILKEKKYMSPLIISSAYEWTKLADSSTELGIVVDDMCGKYGLLKGELKDWNENARFIKALISKRTHVVIFTMRTHIHVETAEGSQLEFDISHPLFSKNTNLNLDNDSMNFSEADKIQFANRYLKEFGLTENEVLQLCRMKETSIGFPLLCRRAESIEGKSNLFDLFSRPLEIMSSELQRLFKEKSVFYGILVLAMLSGGKLTSESINEYSTLNDRKQAVKLIFYSYGGPDVKLADIQVAADTLCGTYLLFNESDESYSFVHHAVEEAVFLSYGRLHPEETLKLCSLQSVCKLCRTDNDSQSSKTHAPALMLDLRPKHRSILIERFIKALETKFPRDFVTIAEANVWSSDQFRTLFMDKCKTVHVLADKDQNSLLVHAANANNCDLTSELLRGMKQICAEYQKEAVSYLTKAAKASCVHKDLCLFKQFMKTGNVNGNDILSLTVEKGSEEAMVFLLQNGADINYRSENGESLLHTACLHERLHIVKLLQSKYSLPVNQSDSKRRSVCHSAASGGSVDILNFLLQKGADPMNTDVDGMNLLHYACLEGKKEMAFHLMDNYSNMLYGVGKGGYTVPHCAAYGGNIDIFKRVCKLMNVPSQTDCNGHSEEKEVNHQQQGHLKAPTKTGETLLHMACLSGKLEMTKYLLKKYPDMINKVNKHNASIAHYAAAAAEGDTISVLKYLISQSLDPWCKTDTQQTLLHFSCISGRLEMAEYLVETYPDMIIEVDKGNRTPAHYAAFSDKVSVMQISINQGMDFWCGTNAQQTLTNRTYTKGQLELIKYLVKKYPDIKNGVDVYNETSAHYAAESGNVSVIQYLTDQGLDPWCRTSTKETLLHKSCLTGELEMTQYLVEKYPDMINKIDNCKRTPAHHAAQSSNVSVLQYLTGQGLDPWCRTSKQQTLLHKSCIAGQLEMTQYLVENYPDMINEIDNTPAHYAARSSNISVLQYLIGQGLDPWCRTSTKETLLHKSCIAGELEMTQYLVEKYPDMINEIDNCKETPAHYAAQSSNVSVLQYLIGQGLDPWCRTSIKETLLHKSCIAGELEMTQYLVKKYPDMINEIDNCKRATAHYAAQSGNVSILQYLIGQGLDPWCRTSINETLLHKSCIAGQLEMTQYLVEKYPDMINEIDNCKRTPAHYAAQSSNVSVLQYLIGQGLDPWCRTSTQQTLLHMSCIAGQLEMTQYLVEKYPDMISEIDNCKETPAHCAAQSSNVSILQYLIGQDLDPWCRTSTQQTLLHKSCIAGQLEMTQYLFEKYPDMINEIDNLDNTPAHYAARSSNISVLQYLIGQGLDPWCRTSTQQTLLHKSCTAGELEMTQYLVEKYPDMINEIDNCKGTPAHSAAQSGNISVLQYLIGQGLDPWCRTSIQVTLLHKSCIAGQLEMTQYLVEKYPDMINEIDNCKRTPAHYAAQSRNVSVLQYLIGQGLDPWCRTSTQQTLLHMSCIAGQLEMTQYLVEKYPDMINEIDNYKETPAHCAAQSSNVSILQYLIGQGLDPWCRTSTQQTLLHMSCITGQLEMTKYLVEKYPDMINEIDNLDNTPAHYAAQSSNISVLQYLIGQGLDPRCRTSIKETLLHKSCTAGQLEMTQYLVEKYPDMINEIDNCKETPAHSAAQSDNVSVLQYLIGQGLDPWCRTSTQQTLLHMSCIAGQLEMTQYLVEKYPDMINEIDNCKETPAHCAAQSSNVSVLQYLIGQDLDPWCRTSTKETLLHKSCIAGELEMTQYLVEKYPDMINEVDDCKQTPIHYAVGRGNVPFLQYLIVHGLDPRFKASTQETLLHMSCIARQLEMTKFLVETYPDMINEFDNCKQTPAHYAAFGGNVSLLEYLIDQGLDPWCRTAMQKTLLHQSCINGQLEMTRYLFNKYPDMINEVDNCQRTPVYYAARSSNKSVLLYLNDQSLGISHFNCNISKLPP